MDTLAAIHQPVSIRSYAERRVDPALLERLLAFARDCDHLTDAPPRVALISGVERVKHVLTFVVGSYGLVRNAPHLLVGVLPEETEAARVDLGFFLEQVVLEATQLGLGTCWITGTYDAERAGDAVDLRSGEVGGGRLCPWAPRGGRIRSAPHEGHPPAGGRTQAEAADRHRLLRTLGRTLVPGGGRSGAGDGAGARSARAVGAQCPAVAVHRGPRPHRPGTDQADAHRRRHRHVARHARRRGRGTRGRVGAGAEGRPPGGGVRPPREGAAHRNLPLRHQLAHLLSPLGRELARERIPSPLRGEGQGEGDYASSSNKPTRYLVTTTKSSMRMCSSGA